MSRDRRRCAGAALRTEVLTRCGREGFQCRFLHQHDGDVLPHRIESTTGFTQQPCPPGLEPDRGLADRAGEDFEKPRVNSHTCPQTLRAERRPSYVAPPWVSTRPAEHLPERWYDAGVPTALPAGFAPERILVVRLSALGDVIRTLPLLPPLRQRFPDAALHWLTEPSGAAVLHPQRLLSQVLVFPRPGLSRALGSGRLWSAGREILAFVRRLRAARFDLVLDAQGTFKSAVLAGASGAPHRIGYARPGAREYLPGAMTQTVAVPPEPFSRVRKALALLGPLGADATLADAGLPLDEEAAAALRRAGFVAQRPLVVLVPGSSRRQAWKRWPADRFGALAAALQDEGVAVRVAWGPGEEPLVRDIEAAARIPGLALPPTSIAELAEVLRQASLVVGNDSGTLHLAALVGTPVVGLYGATDPITNAPFGTGHAGVVAPLPEGGSRRGRSELMLRIGVEEVRSVVLRQLRVDGGPFA